jgi:hypothetical protein
MRALPTILAVVVAVLLASGLAKATENAGVVLSNLPPRESATYADLKRISGAKSGQALEMTAAEMWDVPSGNLAALTEAATKLGVRLRVLDARWNYALAPMKAETSMTPDQKKMMDDTMAQAPVMGMTMMGLPPAEVMEYALTKGMDGAERSELVIELTPDTSVTALRTSISKTKDGYAWHGIVEGTEEPVTLLWWPGGRLSASITYHGHVYSVRSLGGGVHGVIELAPKMLPPEHAPMDKGLMKKMGMTKDPLVSQGDASMMRTEQKRQTRDREDASAPRREVIALGPGAISADPSTQPPKPDIVITVLVAYTKAAARFYSDIETDLVAIAIEDANQSFRNSGLGNIRLELVHTYETGYVESGSHFNHVFRFADKGDGVMDEVHALRDEYHADVSVLIVDDPMGCGLAAQIRAPADRAFAVVDQGCAQTSYSLGHEIGHIIGARHDTALDDNMQPFSYGHGFVHGKEWRTMMSYKDSCDGCPRIPVWSSPAIRIKGVPAGDATSNNARVIAEEAARVAAFR